MRIRHSVLILTLTLSSAAIAQEWTRFRGPNGSGISTATGLPVQWTENDYRWKVRLPGTGHSSPILWGDRLFVTCGNAETAQRIILCLNAADGSTLWEKRYDSKTFRQHNDNSYASSTPAADAQRIYISWTTPDQYTLLALTHDGQEAWKADLGRYTSQHGSGTSPIIFEDMVIAASDQEGTPSFIIALDAKTGQVRWKTPRKSTHMAASTPCLLQPPNAPAQLILSSRTEGLTALDARTGQRIWQAADLFNFRVVASPVIAGDVIVGNCGEGGSGKGLAAVRPNGSATPQLAYKLTSQVPYVPTPLYKDGLLFTWGDAGVISCLRPETGKIVWQERIGSSFYSSPIWSEGKLYCISKKGEVFVISASDKFQLLGKTNLGEGTFATPAIAAGRLYIRTLTQLFCLPGAG